MAEAETSERRTVTAAEKGKLLPGIAGIAMFMLLLTMANVYGALANAYGSGRSKYGVLALCTLLVAGVFGLLRMRRWGWAMVLAGTLLLAVGYGFVFRMTHQPSYIVQAGLSMVFFLYLVRTEVRDRMV
jgi:lysylphosphatidylglycerol synthetase-like protein (DUF2156 family)